MEADDAQIMRKEDMKNAEKDPDLETFCFNLEKTLPLPRIPTNIVYYKRQLCIYNLDILSVKITKGILLCLSRGRSRTWVIGGWQLFGKTFLRKRSLS